MSTKNQTRENFFERHGWLVFLGLSIIITLFGLGDVFAGGSTFGGGEAPTMQGITGMTWEQLQAESPNTVKLIDFVVRSGGAQLFLLGLLSCAVSANAFRRGERWAWFAMWLWPLWLAFVPLLLLAVVKQPSAGIPPPLVSGTIFFLLAMMTLLLSYRKFFRR